MFQNNIRRYVFVLQIDRTLLSMFCTWCVTLWKNISQEPPPPYPSEITAFEPPSPWQFPMIFHGVGGYGYFLEQDNNFFKKYSHMQVVIRSWVLKRKLMNIWKSTATLVQNVQPKDNAHPRTSICNCKMATSCGFWQGACA